MTDEQRKLQASFEREGRVTKIREARGGTIASARVIEQAQRMGAQS
jgi:hypothetical protein